MGRHNLVDTKTGEGTGAGRVWAGRALLLATGVSSVLGAGAGMAAAAPSLDESSVPNVGLTDAYRGPALNAAPSLADAPTLSEGPSLEQVPSLDAAPVDGASVVGQLTGAGMQGGGAVSGSDAAVSGDAGAEGSPGTDGGALAASGLGGGAEALGTLG